MGAFSPKSKEYDVPPVPEGYTQHPGFAKAYINGWHCAIWRYPGAETDRAPIRYRYSMNCQNAYEAGYHDGRQARIARGDWPT